MRRIVSALAAAALLTGLAGVGATASADERRKYRNYGKYERYDRYDRDWRDSWFFDLFPGYQSRNPDNFRPGSRDWWKAMDLEGRGGHPKL
jgi:hypothetical protein